MYQMIEGRRGGDLGMVIPRSFTPSLATPPHPPKLFNFEIQRYDRNDIYDRTRFGCFGRGGFGRIGRLCRRVPFPF